MNWHCFSVVLTWPKIVDMMLPEPVSTIAVSVVGPSGLMSACGLSVALPDLPVVRLTQVTFSGSFCSAAGARGADRGEHVGRLTGAGSGRGDLGGPGH